MVAEVKYLNQANGISTPSPTPTPLDVGTPVNPTHAAQYSMLLEQIPYNQSDLTLTASDTLAISLTRTRQNWLVQGGAGAIAMSTTPFGSSAPLDGTIINVIGAHDTNTVTFADSDVNYGCRMNGTKELAKGDVISFVFVAAILRYCQVGI